MPTAQFHYPFENTEAFATRFPADFICEAIDQTRGWFYSLLAVNTLVFDRTPYKSVVCLAHLDEATRQFLLTLWNVYSFFVTYASLDDWTPDAAPAAPSPHILDKWVRSRLHRTVRTVTESLESFDSLAGAQALAELVDDVCNWY